MPDRADVELIRNAYAAFTKGDMATVDRAFADDIQWHIGGRSPLAGDRKSKQEVFEFFGLLAERSSGTFALEVEDVLGGDRYVSVIVTEQGTRNGRALAGRHAHLWRVENGKAVEFWDASFDPYADDEFWSS
jgi:ketosteroid isomerase-like protein